MFKLESYITPVILSYVEKYVKNFKPEQSQVSLWGGDASFQNLDLRLEVLEEQLNLPFTFVSGHIHELLIHVPWVKITSEPIVVTINTIECVLKLKEINQGDNISVPAPTKETEISQEEAPPGYIKSIVNKVINNITINCNNLILKYVEEDIVLSINVRFLSMQSVNEKWEPAFTDINSYEVKLQKVISIQDLTLCLDKMDTSGKIEIYQDPVLYRCSLTIRLIISYHSNMAKQAALTRFDVHCQKMEFSITEQQIPMIMRLYSLITILQNRQPTTVKEKSYVASEESDVISNDSTKSIVQAEDATWGTWAWSTVSSILPVDWDNDWSNEQINNSGNIIHMGFFINDATITFKTVESVKEQLFYKPRKIKYKSFLVIHFTEAVLDTIIQGISMTNCTMGVGTAQIYPQGKCSCCGYSKATDGVQPPLFLYAGEKNSNYLKNTLFDEGAIENQGEKRLYKKEVSSYIEDNSVSVLLQRCPAFCLDYVHYIEIPDDLSPQRLSEFIASFEYSNFHEERHIRYVIGNLTLQVCAGLFHRLHLINNAAEKYDYTPYMVPKAAPTFDELPPVTVEEYDALRENIPLAKTYYYIVKSSIRLKLDHHNISGQSHLFSHSENQSKPLLPDSSEDPFLSFEFDSLSAIVEEPIYPFRLIACASKQTEIPSEMLAQCYRDFNVQVLGFSSHLFLKMNCRTPIILPCNISYNMQILLYPEYWKTPKTVHKSLNLEIDSLTITGTKRKLMIAIAILTSLVYKEDFKEPTFYSSLYNDCLGEKNLVYIEICLENITHKCVITSTTTSCLTNVTSIKVFAHNETQQAFILSGPEIEETSKENEQLTLIKAVIQFSKDLDNQKHPAILSIQIAPMKASLDPLLLQWMDYHVIHYKVNSHPVKLENTTQISSESVVSDPCGKKKNFPSLHESVHSSSEKDKRKLEKDVEKPKKKVNLKTDESDKTFSANEINRKSSQVDGIWNKLTTLSPWWSVIVLNAHISHITVYMPTETMSGIGAGGIDQAKDEALRLSETLRILVVKSPMISIHSSNIQGDLLRKHLNDLPIMLPKKIWAQKTHSFPWRIEILNFECFTLKRNSQLKFIKKICLKATLDLVTKYAPSEKENNKLSTLSLCLYIDTSPILISMSEEQVCYLSSILKNAYKAFQHSSPAKSKVAAYNSQEPKDIALALQDGSSSPTQKTYVEDGTSTSTASGAKESLSKDEEEAHLTASIQWTIAKISIKLYAMNELECIKSKLVLELEDIITSIDIQPVYFKLKHKITTATVFHYTKVDQQWDFGDYVGILLSGREENFEKKEDSGFVCLTLTMAKSGNVHTRWGARKVNKMQKRDFRTEALKPSDTYITEALVKMQTIDLTAPPSVLSKYMQVLKPFFNGAADSENLRSKNSDELPFLAAFTNLRNESLPLIYLDFKGFRLIMPTVANFTQQQHDDLLMLQVNGIRITPHAENPICRIPLRADIYQLAAQANILNVPGSAVEDRQYQINVDGICAFTTTWKDYQKNLTKQMPQSYFYTMNENPAVEWNKLGNGSSLETHFHMLPVITRFDFCFIIAPAIIFKPDTLVCASAAEINCLTDLEVIINLDQIKLISSLYAQMKNLTSSVDVEDADVFETPCSSKQAMPITSLKSNSNSIRQAILESETDFAKDSGIDFDISSINSITPGKVCPVKSSNDPPFEFLMNCGKITLVVYENVDPMSAEISRVPKYSNSQELNYIKLPLFYTMVNQPNFYFYRQNVDQKVQLSCFDIAVFVDDNHNEKSTAIPSEKHFNACIVETKSGEVHPDTGIPPSFLVIKWEKISTKNPSMAVDLGKPTKVYVSLSRLKKLISIKTKICNSFEDNHSMVFSSKYSNGSIPSSCTHSASGLKRATTPVANNYNVPDLNFSSKQLVLGFESVDKAETLMSVASLAATASKVPRPQRYFSSFSWESFVVSVDSTWSRQHRHSVFLNPCSGSTSLCLLWETWQLESENPQVQLQAECDCVYLDVGPRHVLAVESTLKDLTEVLSLLSPSSEATKEESSLTQNGEPQSSSTAGIHDQHYKDDLKSGAFQFIDVSAEELPFPYQVVFYSSPQQAMAWRYPHPRTLTRIHVAPIPFEQKDETTDDDDEMDETPMPNRIPCAIEYWCEAQTTYQRYVELYLSETDSYRLELSERSFPQAVSCAWRVKVLQTRTPQISSSKALLGCLRFDSYFNPRIVPNLQLAVNVRAVQVRLHNQLEPADWRPPKPLVGYSLGASVPSSQRFAIFEMRIAKLTIDRWSARDSRGPTLLLNATSRLSLRLLDYGLLLDQPAIDSADCSLSLLSKSVTPEAPSRLEIRLNCEPFALRLGPSSCHALAVALQLWTDALLGCTDSSSGISSFNVLTTRFVVANDTNVPVRFCQVACQDDGVLLESRQCYFYSWRQANNQLLKIALEESGWSWSKPFALSSDGAIDVDFTGTSSNMAITVEISSLSATQKMVKFSAHFLISNHLLDSFEMKLIKYDPVGKTRSIVSRDIFYIPSKARPPSIVLIDPTNMAMRLRFSTIPNSSWTGDIPLQPNIKWGQPWLVKVPLQERGQFISIWVRIITEEKFGKVKILAIMSPLYMIRSYLPVPAKVQIDTPSLSISMNATINGKGESQQMYCPGTFEHAHRLTFKIESGVSSSNPHVPLSYDSVDQHKFFKKPEKESIKEILESLRTAEEESKLFIYNDDDREWLSADQPQTFVQVKYEDAGLLSSTLLLELQPWCFILNSVGTHISLVSEDVERCKIPHYGVVAPPKLEGTFQFGVGINDKFYLSKTLRFDKPEWSQSFYKPSLQDSVPMEGNLKICVDNSSSVSMININASVFKDMRVLRVSSNYVIGNATDFALSVATLAVPCSAKNLHLPYKLIAPTIDISPSTNKRIGVPIVQWLKVIEKSDESFVLYITLSVAGNPQSCPVRVDQGLSRKCVALPTDYGTEPLVITTQEDKNVVFIMVHLDKHPQLLIENTCPYSIIVGQANEDKDDIVADSEHFDWKCVIESGKYCHYSMPSVGNRLPDLPNNIDTTTSMLISTLVDFPEKGKAFDCTQWSKSVELNSHLLEQLVRLSSKGDIKVFTRTKNYTTYICLSPVSQNEVSAQDIRNKIEKKCLMEDEQATNEIVHYGLGEERSIANILIAQSASSSASTTTFFSADTELSANSTQQIGDVTVNEKNDSKPNARDQRSLLKSYRDEEKKSQEISSTVNFKEISIILTRDANDMAQRIEVLSLTMTDLVLQMNRKNDSSSSVRVNLGDLQLDNQMFEQGGFDFPVVLISQKPFVKTQPAISLHKESSFHVKEVVEHSLISVELTLDQYDGERVYKEMTIRIAPVNAYVEGAFVTLLMNFNDSIWPPCLITSSFDSASKKINEASTTTNTNICIPEYVFMEAKILGNPLRFQSLLIEPISILLSVHTSMHVYVAFDHSPLYFEAFLRKNFVTTHYRLGNALAMHYLSGAIFGVGWVVGSLEILGSPGGLAQAFGTGLKDFISMPFQGLLQGPWGFIVGVTHGSASLVKHITAGTVNSVTKLASSVARNLDRLTLDDEHLQRQEEYRRTRPQGVAQGLYQGLSGLGMSLLAGVAGLAHQPLQQVWSGEASTRAVVGGVGRGLVGVVTKPLSGAAELVALTGQGLLHGTGWSSLPKPRQRAVVQNSSEPPGWTRYTWRLMPLLTSSQAEVFEVVQAEQLGSQGGRAVSLVLTRRNLLIVSLAEDNVDKIVPLVEASLSGTNSQQPDTAASLDPTLLRLQCSPPVYHRQTVLQRDLSSPTGDQMHCSQMDREVRARVAEFLRTSSTGCITSVSSESDAQSENAFDAAYASQSEPNNTFTFHLNSDSRGYFIAVFNLLKKQNQFQGFAVT